MVLSLKEGPKNLYVGLNFHRGARDRGWRPSDQSLWITK